ncbi:MAG: DUF5399 family protein [Parachlamydiales bacterium]|nr:DUF5399 family protein [Candidatus Acheromyda pituitae]
MMKAITIDNLDIKDHVRWAQDQAVLDPTYLTEAQAVAHHPEYLGMSTIYASQWEALFEWQKRNLPWASFAPPLKYHVASRRLFSFRLFPSIYWSEEEEEEDGAHEDPSDQQEKEPSVNLWKEVVNVAAFPHQPSVLFEKDKTAILNLLESIKYLNEMIAHVSSRKLQYQKG